MWVFGYGSLLWDPGFDPVERVPARLDGYHRSFCMLSIHHRGTEQDPGLVLALDAAEGAACSGIAFRAGAADAPAVLEMLRARELISSAYTEERLEVALTDGRVAEAVTYVIDPHHRQYVTLDLETQAQMIARAAGGRGPNVDYLVNTWAHLTEMGIADADMDWLVERVKAIRAAPGAASKSGQ